MKIIPLVKLATRSSVLRRFSRRREVSELTASLSEDYDLIYVSDEDGILRNKPQLDLAHEIFEEIPTMYEGGIRFAQNLIDIMITGAERAVIGTATLVDLDELRGAFKLSEDITFKVDSDDQDGILSFDSQIAGRAFPELAQDVFDIGLREIIVPRSLARDGVEAKKRLGFSLGVMSSAAEASALETLGADFIIAADYGRQGKND